ncbi:hypothetical protein CHCC15292_3930 [Bacillus licheniformis]|jgi:hypothetical protein|nr:hypothetical protein [Bacillus paralicheniformis]MCA1180123.1 hypothetical protein [Bacillus licheniformis]MEC1282132.1 hypothetical protein [Bacillus paralicheniformis]MEC1301538.1 hypothetical protein [Bacillus paralicheniformis]TWK89869.1 hypothetical protein CHCC20327_0337 [Bacillus licheniformis]TWL13604.1 hypothetical protein CHCC16874_2499 [Bacillus licheniformis]
MDERGWTLNEIDNSDYPFFIELLEHREKLKNPKEQRKRAKTVPIDHVF